MGQSGHLLEAMASRRHREKAVQQEHILMKQYIAQVLTEEDSETKLWRQRGERSILSLVALITDDMESGHRCQILQAAIAERLKQADLRGYTWGAACTPYGVGGGFLQLFYRYCLAGSKAISIGGFDENLCSNNCAPLTLEEPNKIENLCKSVFDLGTSPLLARAFSPLGPSLSLHELSSARSMTTAPFLGIHFKSPN